ncbi:unnamed protein product [Acanthoscelides obtectus]|uniref:Uncharacterized protein n=1 Tax=Acanthoscelides obtectus TaxID=200917 RepID=A0A9P0LD22_ACAOB|nr:unnamed protein product [Acanthoscelides obtectus]CAK1671053.1 hypothetical protein AOBTE_LOCUS28019 [Acanthoscelides obtectus]
MFYEHFCSFSLILFYKWMLLLGNTELLLLLLLLLLNNNYCVSVGFVTRIHLKLFVFIHRQLLLCKYSCFAAVIIYKYPDARRSSEVASQSGKRH